MKDDLGHKWCWVDFDLSYICAHCRTRSDYVGQWERFVCPGKPKQ